MATHEEVQKLASLARITIPEEKTDSFAKEFEAILTYIKTLETLTLAAGGKPVPGVVHNVFRDDTEPHATGLYSKKLIDALPQKEGNLLKVKQILSHE